MRLAIIASSIGSLAFGALGIVARAMGVAAYGRAVAARSLVSRTHILPRKSHPDFLISSQWFSLYRWTFITAIILFGIAGCLTVAML